MNQNHSKVIIHRPKCIVDKLRSFIIVVDNKITDEIKDGQSLDIILPKGKHNIYLKIDWCRSNTFEFSIEENEEIKLECGPSRVGWNIFLSLFYITIWWNKYLWLKRN